MTAQLTAQRSAVGGRLWTFAFVAASGQIHSGPTWRPVEAVDAALTTFKTAGRHPWRCRRTDRSRRAPASIERGWKAPPAGGRALNSAVRAAHSLSARWRFVKSG